MTALTRAVRLVGLLALVTLAAASPASAQEIIRVAGRLRFAVDTAHAYPGGLLVVRMLAPRGISGVLYGILDGRRCPFLSSPKGLRALVPVPVTFAPGETTLGVEVRSSRGRERVAMTLAIRPRSFGRHTRDIPEAKRPTLSLRSAVRDGRLLLLNLRTISSEQQWRGDFKPPVGSEPERTFGLRESYPVPPPVEGKTDAIHGEYHRGLDYPVPAGTVVHAPAAGTVILSGHLTLTGETVVLDHGHGVLSVFYHLARSEARPGESVYAGQRLGYSGDSGLADTPHLHWGVYVHGVAIDPKVMEDLDD